MKHYAFIDYATQLYVGLVAIIILVFHHHAPEAWPWYVAAHAAAMIVIHFLVRAAAAHPRNRVLDFLRHFYPVLMYAWLYRETGLLNQMAVQGYLDATFHRLDER